jgi:hypothetical protein
VEVNWNGVIEVLSFRNPLEAKYLSQATKDEFESTVDLRTQGRRMEGLIAETPRFCVEMERIDDLCQHSPFYRFLYVRIGTFKWLIYVLVVLLNLNLMMVTYGEQGSKLKHPSEHGFSHLGQAVLNLSLLNRITGNDDNDHDDGHDAESMFSVLASLVLALAVLSGYAVTLWFTSMSEIPMLIKQTDARTAHLVASQPHSNTGNHYRNPWAFVSFGLACVAAFACVLMHMINYDPDLFPGSVKQRRQQNRTLYVSLFAPLLGAWFLVCARQWVVVPNTKLTRFGCIAYDLIFTKAFFRNNVAWICLACLGFTANEYFSLLLLDVVSLSAVLHYMTYCITIPGKSLLWVTYLILASCLVFAQFGLAHFEDGDGAWQDTCHGALSCFTQTVYKASRSRKMFGFGSASNRGVNGGNDYMLGMLFDLVWFAWMFILFRIIGGFIFSTFVSLNNTGHERTNLLKNFCFVSGLERAKYGDLGLKEPSFDDLVGSTQNHWNYVKLMLYLVKRNAVDLNGCESFVKECLEGESLAWVPAKTSFAIQKSGKPYNPPSRHSATEAGGGGAGGAKNVQKVLVGYHRECMGLRREVAEVAFMLGRLEDIANGVTPRTNKSAKAGVKERGLGRSKQVEEDVEEVDIEEDAMDGDEF